MIKRSKLTTQERDLLAIWKAKGISNKECGRRLNRSFSTIGRELKRNRWRKSYVAIHAQGLADKRQFKVAHSKHPLKNPDVFSFVIHIHHQSNNNVHDCDDYR
ncbi:helix-turn-helix domain-containing protein [Candidatus Gottesmanbacteria bacterium]|nr:helix-turn-helix domain-containing protein [Candidatus Gottesmanbacteria bacterium]